MGWYALVLTLLGRKVRLLAASRRLSTKVLLDWLLLFKVINIS
jgi:hypothetical protein